MKIVSSTEDKGEQVTKIAKHVAWCVVDVEQAMHRIEAANGDPHEARRRTDMAMVAMLEIVAPVLPVQVQVQISHLVALHDAAWRDPHSDGGGAEQ